MIEGDFNIINETLGRLNELIAEGVFADAFVGAMNTGNGLMQQRIFTRGEDVNGTPFGGYVGRKIPVASLPVAKTQVQRNRNTRARAPLTPYERKRVLAGRQVGYKDLEFQGDLRRSIQVFIEDNRSVVLAFKNDLSALIAEGQEQQITNLHKGLPGTTRGTGAIRIFALSDREIEIVKDQAQELIYSSL